MQVMPDALQIHRANIGDILGMARQAAGNKADLILCHHTHTSVRGEARFQAAVREHFKNYINYCSTLSLPGI